ncbi:SDR family oxidoreductase [Nocardia terpenica]|uniref:Short chain dehydrogenase n=1 Tax=Nocardia terpenica TaxID=455432 RepID=A0A161WFJ1_9NOCA|nr:SDR family oxidoreductase [Nocardia terpenica]KZM75699.1 short chain dehydrogenase [Nocardia terpenica]NQE86206.1 SDR family oxidoreductase [Nocardia terpenica]
MASRKRDFSGKKVLITGAASGIGRSTAVAMARRGAHLALTDINDSGLQETIALITDARGIVGSCAALDISDHDAVAAFARDVHSAFGSPDIVMNIAGHVIFGTVDNLEYRHWKSMIDINLMGPIHVIENFVPSMIRAGNGGHLVNVASVAGLMGLPWHAAYGASKFGLRGISEVLRFDLRRHGIHVHLVVPGAVDTPLVGSIEIVGIDRDNPEVARQLARFQRYAKSPEHVAECIIQGIEKNRFMVYTSNDVRLGHWIARKFSLPYEFAMRVANDQFNQVAPPVNVLGPDPLRPQHAE